ncbi:MAG: hypothetical protein JSV04_07310 [Candidatus Heimdallarchaeota archaeon]|nr:MAG: hypothetical protein JSV04_07310 [Candidatus Heimdallarchaeota archaeon]
MMASFHVREEDGIHRVEEIITDLCIIMDFGNLEKLRLVSTATEMVRLHLEHFGGSEIHFELIEESDRQGLKLMFSFRGGIHKAIEDGTVLKELLPAKRRLSEDKLKEIQLIFSQISEQEKIDLI